MEVVLVWNRLDLKAPERSWDTHILALVGMERYCILEKGNTAVSVSHCFVLLTILLRQYFIILLK